MQTCNPSDMQSDCSVPANRTWAIFLVSVWGLFLEMLLIRWIGTEIRIFAFLQNTVLVVCFLGLGLGCITARKPVTLRSMLVPLFLLVLMMAIPLTREALGSISDLLSVLGDVTIWANSLKSDRLQTIFYASLGLGLTYFVMLMAVEMFIPIGRLLGRLLDEHPSTIRAYSINVVGSLVGIWLFVLLSFLSQPPFTWFLVLALITVCLLDRSSRRWRINFVLLVGTVALSWFAGQVPGSLETVWSPYQKLVVSGIDFGMGFREYQITVNNTFYQAMLSSKNPLPLPDKIRYDLPFLLHPNPTSALILGAGSGNDVAGALRHGVKSTTAVDIDPAIISFGRRYHPDRPYASASVHLVNDDARSFLATCTKKFDVISFGLLDSHTTNAMTNAPLDHYVYTRESIRRAKSLLADHGIMTLCFEAQKPFIADRMGGVLREVFGREPLYFRMPQNYYGFSGVMFIAGDLETARAQIAKNPMLASFIEKSRRELPVSLSYRTRLTTDDWPYIFLKTPAIPLLYYFLACMMAILVIRYRRHLGHRGMIVWPSRTDWHFFFLGAAFLLLEVQNISKASAVLGNTWEVNAVIVTGVLVMVLLANCLASKVPGIPLGWVYSALGIVCMSLYFLDLELFASLPYVAKAGIVGGFATLPMLFSGIVFIRSFTVAAEKDRALGANLFGALFGAMLQSVTFVTGIKALLLIVLGFYLLAMATNPRGKPATVQA